MITLASFRKASPEALSSPAVFAYLLCGLEALVLLEVEVRALGLADHVPLLLGLFDAWLGGREPATGAAGALLRINVLTAVYLWTASHGPGLRAMGHPLRGRLALLVPAVALVVVSWALVQPAASPLLPRYSVERIVPDASPR